MSVARSFRRGTTANHAAFAGLAGEVTIDTDKKVAVVHDGSTAGGFPLKRDNVSATDKLLGRSTEGAGAIEEIACTAAGRDLLAEASASDQRTTLGFGADLLYGSLVFYANATAGATLSDVAAGAAFLGKSNRNIQEIDATYFTQCQISVRITTAAASGTQLRVLYRRVADSFSTTLTDHITIGTSDVAASLDTAGIRTSSWIDLASSAKSPIYVAIEQSGGDGATDPVIAFLVVRFRRR